MQNIGAERRIQMKLDLYNNPVMRVLSKVADLMLLNLMFMISCLPIVTIGTAISSMYTITLKMVKGEEAYIFKGFLKAFKENFKVSMLAWLIMLPAGLIIIMNFNLVEYVQGSGIQTALRVMIFFVGFIYVIVFTYLFPLIARYETTLKQTFQNALLMAVSKLPYTILMIAIAIAPFFLVFVNAEMFAIAILVGLLVGFAGVAYINSMIFRHVFKSIDALAEELDSQED